MKTVGKKQLALGLLALLIGVVPGAPIGVATAVEVGAPAPDGVGEAKYDATATTMVGLLKYGCGLPFHRIETLQRAMRIPLPAATQWELVRDALPPLVPA